MKAVAVVAIKARRRTATEEFMVLVLWCLSGEDERVTHQEQNEGQTKRYRRHFVILFTRRQSAVFSTNSTLSQHTDVSQHNPAREDTLPTMIILSTSRALHLIVGSSLAFAQTSAYSCRRLSSRHVGSVSSPHHHTIINSFCHRTHTSILSMNSSSHAQTQFNMESYPLSGKTAYVSGSSGGIGAAIAKTFARAGADIIVHYNSREDGALSTCKEINALYDKAASSNSASGDTNNLVPGRCLGVIQADFRDASAVDEMFQYITTDILKDNRLDILVNNAGIVTKLALEDDDDNLSVWHETMSVNLHAPVQLMRLAHSHMKSTTKGTRKGGVIINNTSIHGSRSVEFMTAYAASKAALDSLTRGLSCEYAPDGIRVNAIAPGVVPVERTAQAFADPKVTDMWLPHLPVGRLGTVEDIAEATLVLATNEWMTGTVLTVDGGMMARANMPNRPKPPKPEPKANTLAKPKEQS